MDQKQTVAQAKGNITANLIPNPGKSRYGKRMPDVRGRISMPNTPEQLRNIALYSFEYTDRETGEVLIGYNGQMDPINRAASGIEQLRSHASRNDEGRAIKYKDLTIENNKMVVYQSKHKDGPLAENGNRKNEFYGYVNDGGELVQISLWTHKNKDTGLVFLGGSTQYPLPEKDGSEFSSMSEAEIDHMASEYDQDGPAVGYDKAAGSR